MGNERINSIEKRIVELKFIERDIIRERELARYPLLKNSESSARIEELINSFFINTMKCERKKLIIIAYPSKYNGRDDEEFLSEVKVDITYKPDSPSDYNELTLTVFINNGFEDQSVRELEGKMMDRLFDIRDSINKLREEKRRIKNGGLS